MLINQDFTWDRTKYMGGSDIGAILGLSKFKTPLQVWQEKTGKEIPKLDSLPLRFGSFAEEFVAQEYTRQTGLAVTEYTEPFIHPTHSFLAGHIDRLVLEPNTPLFDSEGQLNTSTVLECKTANPFAKDEWGDTGTDEVPLSYLVQCAWYLLLTGCEKADLAVFFSSSDFRIYTIHRDAELESILLEKAVHFWNHYVLGNRPPPPVSESDYKLLYPQTKLSKSVEVSTNTFALLRELPTLNQEISEREDRISQIKQALMGEMQDSEILMQDGKTIATWKNPKPSFKFDSKQFAIDEPVIAAQYQMPIANSRRLVIKEVLLKDGE